MKPSDSKTKPLQHALVPVFALIALALYAPYTEAYTRQDVVLVALVGAAVLVILRLTAVLVQRYGAPVVDVRTYPCGATVETRGWELAGITHGPTRRPGCPQHRGRCPSDAQNQG